jgi:AraC family transcriptional regulator, positive regulator of tynA and feaB
LNEAIVPSSLLVEQLGALLALSLEKQAFDSPRNKFGMMNRLLTLLRENASEPEFSPRKLAGLAGVSVRHIHGTFAAAGMTFGKSLQDIRMEKALGMLNSELFKGKQISEISILSGYKCVSHFIRHFRAHCGVSPGVYRKSRFGSYASDT